VRITILTAGSRGDDQTFVALGAGLKESLRAAELGGKRQAEDGVARAVEVINHRLAGHG
jgi:hypothetical protein